MGKRNGSTSKDKRWEIRKPRSWRRTEFRLRWSWREQPRAWWELLIAIKLVPISSLPSNLIRISICHSFDKSTIYWTISASASASGMQMPYKVVIILSAVHTVPAVIPKGSLMSMPIFQLLALQLHSEIQLLRWIDKPQNDELWTI